MERTRKIVLSLWTISLTIAALFLWHFWYMGYFSFWGSATTFRFKWLEKCARIKMSFETIYGTSNSLKVVLRNHGGVPINESSISFYYGNNLVQAEKVSGSLNIGETAEFELFCEYCRCGEKPKEAKACNECGQCRSMLPLQISCV